MFETEDSVLNCDSGEDQPSPSFRDEEWLETDDYRLGFENDMMRVREQYELRIKKNQDASKPKAPEVTIKKIPDKTSKASAVNSKSAAESSGKHKEKDNQKMKNKESPLVVLALRLVLLIQLFLTLYIMRNYKLIWSPRWLIKQSRAFPRVSPLSI